VGEIVRGALGCLEDGDDQVLLGRLVDDGILHAPGL
jgi:hypothetical protein